MRRTPYYVSSTLLYIGQVKDEPILARQGTVGSRVRYGHSSIDRSFGGGRPFSFAAEVVTS